MHFVFHQDNFY